MSNPIDKQIEEQGIPFGKYRLIAKLAVGGMAELFLAKQEGIGGFSKTVVIKCILPYFSQKKDFMTMFLDEARVASYLNHPNVVQIYDIGEIDGILYMAMEYIPGTNLKMVRKRLAEQDEYRNAPPYPLLAAIFAQAAAGLEHIHTATDENGEPLHLVHRDISPNNLMLSYDGMLKIVDFGVAKARTQEHETEVGVLKGRLSYMSPEHLSGQVIDGRSDIFALAVVLYEMSTGKRLFKRRTEAETIKALLTTPIPPPSRIKSNYPKPLEDLLLKALNRNPNERFQTATELRIALEDYLNSEGVYYGPQHIADIMSVLFAKEIEDEKNNIYPTPVSQEDLINLSRGSYRVMQPQGSYYDGRSYQSYYPPQGVMPQQNLMNPTQPYAAGQSYNAPYNPNASYSAMPQQMMPPQGQMGTGQYHVPPQHPTGSINIAFTGSNPNIAQPMLPPTNETAAGLTVNITNEEASSKYAWLIAVALIAIITGAGLFWITTQHSSPKTPQKQSTTTNKKKNSPNDAQRKIQKLIEQQKYLDATVALANFKKKYASSHSAWIQKQENYIRIGSQLDLAQKLYRQNNYAKSKEILKKITQQYSEKTLLNIFPQFKLLKNLLQTASPTSPQRNNQPPSPQIPHKPQKRLRRKMRHTRKKRHRRSNSRSSYRKGKVLPFSSITLPRKIRIAVYRRQGSRRIYTNAHPRLCRQIERAVSKLLGRSMRGVTRPWQRYVKQRFARSRRKKFVFYPRAAAYVIYHNILRGKSKHTVAQLLVKYQKYYRFKRYSNK